jgi:catechol 2,3-dioxygenase-like lactoylglutathione lyase family enzyme
VKAREPFPILYSRDVADSAAFYRDAFGFAEAFRWPLEGEPAFVYLRLDPTGIGIGTADGENVHGNPISPGAGSFELCLYVDDMDAARARLRTLGAKELRPPVEEPWGESRAYFADPDGNTLHLAMTLSTQ